MRWPQKAPVSPAFAGWLVLFAITLVLSNYSRGWSKAFDARWIVKYPAAWRMSLNKDISAAMKWLVEDANFGLFTFRELTRAISWLIQQPYDFVLSLLATGFVQGYGLQAVEILPPLSWLAVIIAVMALGHYARDWALAALAGVCFGYLAIFGQWDSAMITLASIVIAVPFGAFGGLMLGIWAYRSPNFERVLRPILDLMQTIPIFAYLVPILFLFGFGPVSALVSTIIYAMPPMVRVTMLALHSVPPEIRDFGKMTGCTKHQMMWKVLVPTAKPDLMVGVNQVIMLSLNMVIIASMIGAGGLGFDVLSSLRRLDIGGGLEAGIAIVVLAIALDRLSQAFAGRRTTALEKNEGATSNGLVRLARKYPRTFGVVIVSIVLLALGMVVAPLQSCPEAWHITTGDFWANLVKTININFFDQLEAAKTFMLTTFLLPVKRFLGGIPWAWGIFIVAIAGWHLGGWRLGIMCAVMGFFIAANGLWAKAMTTVYLCGVSVVIASIIGIPIGILSALNRRADRFVGVAIDTLQTLPSFVYLIPVVMLFRVGDFSAMIAVVLYALAPAVRYASHGIKTINPQLVEAGIVSGCTKWQLLRRIRMPLAMPEIMLGINQTIMLALSMLVITALVGTRDLGQEVYIALTKADTGRGIIAGLAIAFIAIIADRLIAASAANMRKRYGLEGP
ncbi:MAG: ABC transporter permease subunit [Rhizobiales bacterium]|nr:ABC transporter permease subunit [Hyphomicrobiales bacterium]